MYVLQSGRKITVERGWKKRNYRPTPFSLVRCVRLLLSRKYGLSKQQKWVASSTTGGWEYFDVGRTSRPCDCKWHCEHFPEWFVPGVGIDFGYPEPPINYHAE